MMGRNYTHGVIGGREGGMEGEMPPTYQTLKHRTFSTPTVITSTTIAWPGLIIMYVRVPPLHFLWVVPVPIQPISSQR